MCLMGRELFVPSGKALLIAQRYSTIERLRDAAANAVELSRNFLLYTMTKPLIVNGFKFPNRRVILHNLSSLVRVPTSEVRSCRSATRLKSLT